MEKSIIRLKRLKVRRKMKNLSKTDVIYIKLALELAILDSLSILEKGEFVDTDKEQVKAELERFKTALDKIKSCWENGFLKEELFYLKNWRNEKYRRW